METNKAKRIIFIVVFVIVVAAVLARRFLQIIR